VRVLAVAAHRRRTDGAEPQRHSAEVWASHLTYRTLSMARRQVQEVLQGVDTASETLKSILVRTITPPTLHPPSTL
jgi:hypothetical protein